MDSLEVLSAIRQDGMESAAKTVDQGSAEQDGQRRGRAEFPDVDGDSRDRRACEAEAQTRFVEVQTQTDAAHIGDTGGDLFNSLKERIMAEIEAKLSQKEESLWARGQVELRRLQLEQTQVSSSVAKLHERQAALITENQKIREALFDVGNKVQHLFSHTKQAMEFAATGRAGVPTVGMSPSPSVASTTATKALGGVAEEHPPSQRSSLGSAPGGPGTPDGRTEPQGSERPRVWGLPLGEPPAAPGAAADVHGSDTEEAGPISLADATFQPDCARFRTPPRAAPAGVDELADFSVGRGGIGLGLGCNTGFSNGGLSGSALPPPMPPSSWSTRTNFPLSPCQVLSLARALPKAPATPASAAAASTPSAGLKRLQLAECLDAAAPQEAAHATQAVSADAAASDVLSTASPSETRPSDGAPAPAARAKLATAGGAAQAAAAAPQLPAGGIHEVVVVKELGFVTLGMEVEAVQGSTLHVEAIDDDGLIGRYNAKQDSDSKRVLRNDRILKVNGVGNDAAKMMLECKEAQRIAFKILRGSRVPEAAAKTAQTAASRDVAACPTPSKTMRAEAQVFVPSFQQSSSRPTFLAPPPPGLDLPKAIAQTAPVRATKGAAKNGKGAASVASDATRGAAAESTPDASKELVKRLFH